MKTLYIECKMGAAGDMLSAALLDLLSEDEKNEALEVLSNIGLEGVEFSVEKSSKCEINGNHVKVLVNGMEEESNDGHEHEHEHHHVHEHHHEHSHHQHHHFSDIQQTVNSLNLPENVKKDVIEVYSLLAKAESHAHGVSVEEIHFHEVGNKDAIMDISAVCFLLNKIGADRIIASPVNAGSGTVRCAHGVLPVPAPATEFLLRGIPYYQGKIQSELCTPTGAALLKHFASDFIPLPVMKIEKTGIGCGNKDFEVANIVRVFLGTELSPDSGNSETQDQIIELDANVDDMSAEEISFAMARLFDAGAREVFTVPVNMKKNRPGTLITVICSVSDKEKIVEAFFKHTSTIGLRFRKCERCILERKQSVFESSIGSVGIKESTGYGTSKAKIEFDDLEKIALKENISLREAREIILKEMNGTTK